MSQERRQADERKRLADLQQIRMLLFRLFAYNNPAYGSR